MTLGHVLELVGPAVCCAVAGLVLRWLVLALTLWACWWMGIDPTADTSAQNMR